MKKLLVIIKLSLLLSMGVNAEIVFRAKCENPKGVMFSSSIAHLRDNKQLGANYEEDSFLGSDKIELIYDNNKPNEIQFIWGSDNKMETLYAKNKNFYHWGFIKENNLTDGFYFGHWSFSLPNKTLTYYKGNTHKTGISTGIQNGLYSSKCEIIE